MRKHAGIRLAAGLVAGALLAGAGGVRADIVTDGSFENVTSGGPGTFTYNPTSPDWTFSSTSGVIEPPSAFGAPTSGFDGTKLVFLQSNTGDMHDTGTRGVISQSITLPSAGVYQFSIQEAFRGGQPAAQYSVNIGGQALVNHSAPGATFTTNSFKFLAPAALTGGPQTFALVSTGPTDSATFLDNASITPSTSTFSTRLFSGDADSGISSSKTYTHAINFNHAAGDVNINGVTFTNGGTSGSNYTLTSTTGSNSFTGNSNNVTGNANALVSDFFYNGTETLTLTGLTPGQTYTTTFYNAAFGNPGGRWATISDSFGNTIVFDENYSGAGNGNLLQDTYTADASGQAAFTFLPTSPGDTYHMYAFSNESVPEPGTIGLLGLGAVGMLARRRRGK